jgi:hypothetical protein
VQGELEDAVDALEQLCGSLVALGAALGDVARRDDLRGGGWFRIAALLLALTPLISCRIPMGIRYPRDL